MHVVVEDGPGVFHDRGAVVHQADVELVRLQAFQTRLGLVEVLGVDCRREVEVALGEPALVGTREDVARNRETLAMVGELVEVWL